MSGSWKSSERSANVTSRDEWNGMSSWPWALFWRENNSKWLTFSIANKFTRLYMQSSYSVGLNKWKNSVSRTHKNIEIPSCKSSSLMSWSGTSNIGKRWKKMPSRDSSSMKRQVMTNSLPYRSNYKAKRQLVDLWPLQLYTIMMTMLIICLTTPNIRNKGRVTW